MTFILHIGLYRSYAQGTCYCAYQPACPHLHQGESGSLSKPGRHRLRFLYHNGPPIEDRVAMSTQTRAYVDVWKVDRGHAPFSIGVSNMGWLSHRVSAKSATTYIACYNQWTDWCALDARVLLWLFAMASHLHDPAQSSIRYGAVTHDEFCTPH